MERYVHSLNNKNLRAAEPSVRPAHADEVAADDDDAAAEVAERVVAEERGQRVGDGLGVLRVHPKDRDAGVGAWWVAADVSEPTVQGDYEPVVPQRGCEDVRIARTAELLVYDGVDVVAERRPEFAALECTAARPSCRVPR